MHSKWLTRRWILGLTAACLAFPVSAHGYTRYARWDATTSPVFPVVRVNFCASAFAAYMPWLPPANIRRQAMSAMNEWFVGGGSHIRLRAWQELPANDPQCAPGASAAPGTILISAEPMSGSQPCDDLGRAFTTGSPITSAKIIIFATQRLKIFVEGQPVCPEAGRSQSIPWAANADFPEVGQIDMWAVFLHEIGHTLGFHHSTACSGVTWVETPAMCPGTDAATTILKTKRHIAADDREGLRDAWSFGYGPVQTQLAHRRSTDNGATWLNEGEPWAPQIVGNPAVCYRNAPPAGQFNYLVATQDSGGWDKVATFTSDGVNATSRVFLSDFRSYHAPAVACGSSNYVLVATAVDSKRIWVKASSNAVTWSASVDTGEKTGVAPAVAFAGFKGWYILAFVHPGTQQLRTMVSKNNGATFGFTQHHDSIRSSHPIGITCQDSGQYCSVSYAHGGLNETPLMIAKLKFDASDVLFVESQAYAVFQTYGGGAASNSSRFEYVWRDRGTATVLTSGGWPWPPSLDTVTFSPLVTHSAPQVAWGALWAEFATYYSYGGAYDAL